MQDTRTYPDLPTLGPDPAPLPLPEKPACPSSATLATVCLLITLASFTATMALGFYRVSDHAPWILILIALVFGVSANFMHLTPWGKKHKDYDAECLRIQNQNKQLLGIAGMQLLNELESVLFPVRWTAREKSKAYGTTQDVCFGFAQIEPGYEVPISLTWPETDTSLPSHVQIFGIGFCADTSPRGYQLRFDRIRYVPFKLEE